jgi:hypothetical protein
MAEKERGDREHPVVINPEAVGNPDETPIVQLPELSSMTDPQHNREELVERLRAWEANERFSADRPSVHYSADERANRADLLTAAADQLQADAAVVEELRERIAVELLSEASLARVSGALRDLGVDGIDADTKAATVVCAAIDGTPALQHAQGVER